MQCELREPAKYCGPCALCLFSRGSHNAVWGAGVSVSPVSALDGCLKGLFALQGACCEAPSLPSWALSSLDQANSVAWLLPYLKAHVACRLTLDYPCLKCLQE